MISRFLLLAGCALILFASNSEAQNETSSQHETTIVTRLGTAVTQDPAGINPPTSMPSQQNVTTPIPSVGGAPQATTTEVTHTEVTSPQSTTMKTGETRGTDRTQNTTTEATPAVMTTTAEATAQALKNATGVTTAEATAQALKNETGVTTTEATSPNATEATTSPVIHTEVTTATIAAMESNFSNVTTVPNPGALTSTENYTTWLITTVTGPPKVTSGLGDGNRTTTVTVVALLSDNTATTVDPNRNSTCNETAYVCLNAGTCYEYNNRPKCRCSAGWTGTQCESDINECQSTGFQSVYCDRHANCSNSQGGYNCTCQDGYYGNGSVCTYDDRCDTNPCVNGFCLSRSSSYECFCPPETWRGPNCTEDVDECMGNSHRCRDVPYSVCVNKPGSYICQCPLGYYGNPDVNCIEDILYPSGAQNVSLMKEKNSEMMVDIVGGFPYFGQMYYRMRVTEMIPPLPRLFPINEK